MQTLKQLMILGMLLYASPSLAVVNIFACEPEWATLAERIGGDRVKVYSATTGRQDPHHIEARPSLIAKARRADLLFCTGAGLEQGWLPLLLRKAGNAKILEGRLGYLMASAQVDLLDKPQSLDRRLGDVHAAGNPHLHLNPHNILKVARALTRTLGQLDRVNQDYYNASMDDFDRQWTQAIARWERQAETLRGTRYVVNHKSWPYLAQWLKLDMSLTLEPYPGIPPTAEHLAHIIELADKNPIAKIIYSAHSNPRSAHWLSKRTGITAIELPYTVGGSAQAGDLYRLFDETLRLLKE